VYATPDNCDKFRVRGVVGRTTRWTDDKTGVPDFTVRARDASRVFDSVPRVFLDFPRKRRRGCRLVRARLVSARERLVLASLRGVRCFDPFSDALSRATYDRSFLAAVRRVVLEERFVSRFGNTLSCVLSDKCPRDVLIS